MLETDSQNHQTLEKSHHINRETDRQTAMHTYPQGERKKMNLRKHFR